LKVAVIGGAGRMGKWLVKYFLAKGYAVIISDIKHDEAKVAAASMGVRLAKDNIEAARDADLCVVSTPIEVTPKVLQEIASEVKETTIVMEISSLKSEVIQVLEEIAKRNVKTLSIHPLFGPGADKLAEEKIVLVPLLEPASETILVRRFFPEADIIVVEAEEHDRIMALTLSLPHFLNIVFASVMSEEDLNVLKKLGGTTFTLQSVISEGVMTEDPRLYASIQMSNKYTVRYLEKTISRAETLKEYVARKDSKNFFQFYANICSSLSKDVEFSRAYERMYKALEAL